MASERSEEIEGILSELASIAEIQEAHAKVHRDSMEASAKQPELEVRKAGLTRRLSMLKYYSGEKLD